MVTIAVYVGLVAMWGFGPYAVAVQLGVVAPEMPVAYRFGLGAVILLAACVAGGRSVIARATTFSSPCKASRCSAWWTSSSTTG